MIMQIFGKKWLRFLCVTVLAAGGLFFMAKEETCAAPEYVLSEAELESAAAMAGKGLMKKIPLNADTVTQIPRYIVEGNAAYVLDETSIFIEVTGYGSSEGADVVRTSKRIDQLPDNDLVRIEKAITYDGIDCELLCVVYEITEKDERGIPSEYAALCEYGGLRKYSNSYPTNWQATVCYDAYEVEEQVTVTVVDEEERNSRHIVQQEVLTRQEEPGEKGPEEIEEEAPEVSLEKAFSDRTLEADQLKRADQKTGLLFPLLAAFFAALVLMALLFYFSSLSAPLFALTAKGKYHYIGQIKIKKKNNLFYANLTNRLISKAELPAFKIKIPEKMRKRIQKEVFTVKCPDGKTIETVLCAEILFELG